ncbi:MAG: hypothetical protein DRI46_13370 [Chloroflexi bacterium]|nr:MAG: hypothetical protein DRI46_13370 [Chloroflexota bacterium]
MKTFDERRAEMDYGNDSKYLTGWEHLFEEADKLIAVVDPDYEIIQIKEKFGGMRYYYTHSEGCKLDVEARSALWQLVGDIEDRAGTICERCGDPSERQNRDHWITTICDGCFEIHAKD